MYVQICIICNKSYSVDKKQCPLCNRTVEEQIKTVKSQLDIDNDLIMTLLENKILTKSLGVL